MLRLCRSEGVGTTPWSPLARGRLARPWADEPPTDRAKTDAFGKKLYVKTEDLDRPIVERVAEMARERGVPMAQIAMAWLLRQPGVTSPIVGATRPQHLDDAIAAASLTISDAEASRLEELYRPHPATEAFS
jgi:aryl-alcohol dehydrogenase-like predicted oxidoreductase